MIFHKNKFPRRVNSDLFTHLHSLKIIIIIITIIIIIITIIITTIIIIIMIMIIIITIIIIINKISHWFKTLFAFV